jgi:antibiotic biosynthesis monooxygenase (ABM) superfamily enzyme
MTVSIIVQTTVRPERAEDFARWQGETSTIATTFPGFLEQRLVPPNPPLQVDWVIVQRFDTSEHAQRWLASPERQARLEGVIPMVIGRDDVHIVRDDEGGIKPAPASVVISTRVLPGKELEYRAWEREVAAAQATAPGMQGYRFEPPMPGVQEDFVAILRFDSEANLQGWLNSPQRKKLLEEAAQLTVEFHTRMARTGFEQWFRDVGGPGSGGPPVWKMDFLVLLMLYPVVFLWSLFVGIPLLAAEYQVNLAIALLIGNIFSVGLTGFMVPWVAKRFGWWLAPSAKGLTTANLLGAGIILALFAAMLVAFYYASP